MASDEAVVNYGPQPFSVELREIPRAAIEPDEVLLEVGAVGVCGSDLHMWADTPSWPMRYPVVLGHEFAGRVAEVGDRVTRFSVGDPVVSETHARFDPHGPLARVGHYHLDPSRRGFGAVVDGAMRHYVPVPERILHRLPEELSMPRAALAEPCCVAYNAVVEQSPIRVGDRVVVLGPGPIGILCAALARARGAQVAVVGLARDRARLDAARQYGCETLVDQVDDWAREGGRLGADVVVDAAGVTATLKTALDIVRPEGWITKVGWGPQPLDASIDPLVQKNVTLQGSFSHYWPVWERVVQLLATGQLDVQPILGGTWPLRQWQQAFETMHAGEIVKAVLEP